MKKDYIESLLIMKESVLKLGHKQGFKIKTFENTTGGIPDVNINSIEILDQDQSFNYKNINGTVAYSGYVKINCFITGIIDDEGLDIYITENGIFFVAEYEEGSPSCFDRTIIQRTCTNCYLLGGNLDINEIV